VDGDADDDTDADTVVGTATNYTPTLSLPSKIPITTSFPTTTRTAKTWTSIFAAPLQ
jgi:hypothetical protein